MATTKYGRGESEFVTEGAGIVPAQKGPQKREREKEGSKGKKRSTRYTVARGLLQKGLRKWQIHLDESRT